MFRIGQVVEVLRQRDPDVWKRAIVTSVPNRVDDATFYNVIMEKTKVETAAVPEHMRQCGKLGPLEGIYDVVNGCNGIYVYHISGYCTCAGDGVDMSIKDLREFARTDPSGFEEAYGPPGDFGEDDETW